MSIIGVAGEGRQGVGKVLWVNNIPGGLSDPASVVHT